MTPEELTAKIAKNPELAAKPTYLAYCTDCGGMVGCCVDSPDFRKSSARFALENIQSGHTITHGINADVWGARWCDCHKKTKVESQPSLF